MKEKNLHAFLLGLLLLSMSHFSFGQELFHYDVYKNSVFKGDSSNGVRTGKWIEVDSSGVVYSESFYDSLGNPINSWLIYTPAGLKRFETVYSYGEIAQINIYRNEKKIVELIPEKYIQPGLYQLIRAFEDSVCNIRPAQSFEIDNIDLGNSTNRVRSQGYKTYSLILSYDFFEKFMTLLEKLTNSNFTGYLHGYNINETIRRSYYLKEDDVYKTSFVYSGSGKKLKRQVEFKNDSILKTIYYKGNGEVRKIK